MSVSIIIPCFNRENTVQFSIESALSQAGKNLEVIVVDDGSTDNSWGVISRFKGQVLAVKTKNRGVSSARNLGIKIASKHFIKFLDSDDCLSSDSIETQIQASNKFPDSTICISRATTMSASGKSTGDNYGLYPPGYSGPVPLTMLLRASTGAPLPLFSAKCLRKVNGFTEGLSLGEDYELLLKLWMQGCDFHQIDYAGYGVRLNHGPRLSTDKSLLVFRQAHAQFLRLYGELLANNRRPLKMQEWKAFGMHIWALGREAARAGYRQEAASLFTLAETTAGTGARVGTWPTLWLTTLVGPYKAEAIMEYGKSLFARDR